MRLQELPEALWADVFDVCDGTSNAAARTHRMLRATCQVGLRSYDVAVAVGGVTFAGSLDDGEAENAARPRMTTGPTPPPPLWFPVCPDLPQAPSERLAIAAAPRGRLELGSRGGNKGFAFRHKVKIRRIVVDVANAEALTSEGSTAGPFADASLGYQFLGFSGDVTHVAFAPACAMLVRGVGHDCLSNASSLRALDLAGLCGITSIGERFLFACSSLTALDLSPLRSVVAIAGSFLAECSALKQIDTAPLRSLVSLGPKAFMRCWDLRTLSLEGLTKLSVVCDAFCMGCTGLVRLDTSPFAAGKVTTVGSKFAAECTSLTEVSLAGFTSVTKLGSSFLRQTTALESVDLAPLAKVRMLDHAFCQSSGIRAIDLTPLAAAGNLKTLEASGFLQACPNLAVVVCPKKRGSQLRHAVMISKPQALTTGDAAGMPLTSTAVASVTSDDIGTDAAPS